MTDSPFQPLEPRPLWAAVADQLRELIDSGQIPVGSKLPSERQLCAELGVSRVSLREAFRVLQSDGYLETRAGAGTFARLPERQPGSWLENDIHVIELFELRLVIEPGTAALAARRRHTDDIAKLAAAVKDLEAAGKTGDLAAALEADARFHQLVGESVSNPSLSQLVGQMQDLCGVERQASLTVPGQIERAVVGHQEILDAIVARDADAANQAMTDHLRDAVALLTEHHNDRYLDLTKTQHGKVKHQ